MGLLPTRPAAIVAAARNEPRTRCELSVALRRAKALGVSRRISRTSTPSDRGPLRRDHEPPTARSHASAVTRISVTCPPDTGSRHTDNHRDGVHAISGLAGSALGVTPGSSGPGFVDRPGGAVAAGRRALQVPLTRQSGGTDCAVISRGESRFRKASPTAFTAPVETRSLLGSTGGTRPRHEPGCPGPSVIGRSRRSAGADRSVRTALTSSR